MKLPDWDDSKGDRPTVKEIEEFPDPQTQQPIPHTYFANLYAQACLASDVCRSWLTRACRNV